MERVEYLLKNLNCAHCASLIEDTLGKMDGVMDHSLNFVSKKLILNVKNENKEEILTAVKETIVKIEPVVEIEEIGKSAFKDRMKVKLEGLGCSTCAQKMETQISQLDQVFDCSINFSNGTMSVRLVENADTKGLEKEIEAIVKSIEDHVNVIFLDESKMREYGDSQEKPEFNKKKELAKVMFAIVLFVSGLFANSINKDLSTALFVAAYAAAGYKIVIRALKNLKNGMVFDENFLMSVATIGAFSIGEYPEAAGVMIFYIVGEYFQAMAVDSSRRSIQGLLNIRPDFANILRGDEEIRVSPQEVCKGDIVIVKPGERIPLDGEVIDGKSSVDTSMLTGESVLRTARVGDKVMSGTINKNGVLKIRVETEFYESTVSKILDLVENAGAKKAKTEKFLTKFAKYYTPAVVLMALLVAIVPPFFIAGAQRSEWLYRGLIFLVVSCPCALVVSIPLSFFAGIGKSSKSGILVKGSNYLEALNKVDKVVFDKTGTLTKGIFEVTKIKAVSIGEEKLVEYAAIAESMSNHPIAVSIRKKYQKEIAKSDILEYEEIEGHGIRAKILVGEGLIKTGIEILAGNHRLMDKFEIDYEKVDEAGTIVYVASRDKYFGYILISDEIKEDSKRAVSQLQKLGIKTYMLTGDNRHVAKRIGSELSIDSVHFELLPSDKVEIFEKIQSESDGLTIFVGDGINDAPVLARADIGIAMGGVGSDAALEAADMVIMNDETSKLKTAIDIAKKTRKIVIQNIVFSLGIKICVMALGVLGSATMWQGVFADVGVALIAVLNALRILRS